MDVQRLESNRQRFFFELEAVAELIQFALDRKQNPSLARSVLHAIGDHMHEMKNIFSPLSAEVEFIKEGYKNDLVKRTGTPEKRDPRQGAGAGIEKSGADGSAE